MFDRSNAYRSDDSNQLTASPLATILGKRMTGKRLRCTVPFFQFAAAATVSTRDAAMSSQQNSPVPQHQSSGTPQRLWRTWPLPQRLVAGNAFWYNEPKFLPKNRGTERRIVAGGFGGTPPVLCRPGVRRAPATASVTK